MDRGDCAGAQRSVVEVLYITETNMKPIFSGLLMAAMVAMPICAQEYVREFEVSPAKTVRMPLPGDSINFLGHAFTDKELLKSSVTVDELQREGWQRVQADTAGYCSLNRPDEGICFYLLSADLRAERFLRGTLKVSSPAPFEVLVNGESKQSKTSVEDSLEAVRPTAVSLRLEPEKDYEIVLKVMASAQAKCAPVVRCQFEQDKEFQPVAWRCEPGMLHRFALKNTAYGPRASRVSLSPNGRYLVLTRTNTYNSKRHRTVYELIEAQTGRRLASVSENAAWMPRSSRLYYTVTGECRRNLMQLDPATGEEMLVKANIPDGHFTYAPTEDYLIYSIQDEVEKEEGPLKRILMPDDRIPGSRGSSQLAKYDLTTGVLEQLTYGSHGAWLNDISPDGKRLLCTSSRQIITQHPYNFTTLFEINLQTLQADTLIVDEGFLNRAAYSPDGRQLVLMGSPSAFGEIGKNCSLPIANDFDTQAFVMNLADRQITPITRDFNPTVELLQWNRTDGCLYFKTTDRDCQHIYRYSPKEHRFEMLPLKEDVITSFALAADAPAVAAYVGGGNYSIGVAYLYDGKKQASRLLADPFAPTLQHIQLGKMEEWNFTAADGTEITGQICLPPDFDPNRKYPLIVYYYGGTTPTTRGIYSPYSAQLFAAYDYVVYVIQPSGAVGFGQEFSARHVNAWGDWTADEIIEGTRKFCEAHPFVDAKRVGCVGASYGGFMTQYLQTKTDFFAAAVSHAGISNVTSYWGEGYWGYSYNSVAAARSYPWTRPDLFTKHGSLFNADKINTPLLLLHGTADTNVPIGESIQLYNALKILGKPVEFITVDGENHHILEENKREQWHKTMMAWFARWLQDSPEWWNDLYPERHW